jgi:hypothetical protein
LKEPPTFNRHSPTTLLMSTEPKPPATDDSSARLQAILDACNNPTHTKILNVPSGPNGGAKKMGLSFSVDAPGTVCDRRHAVVAPPADGEPVHQSDNHEVIRGQQGHWTEAFAPHARMLTGHDAHGNVWAIQFHKGGGRVESFIDHLGGIRSVVMPNQGAAATDSGICLDCLKAAAAAGSATVARS